MFNTQKASILLAMLAWLMQLSVFITPIFVKHPELYYGICEQLAVVIQPHQHVESPKIQDQVTHSQHSQHMTSSVLLTHDQNHHEKSSSPPHHSDSDCKFCLLLGHQFNPILLVCLVILFTILLSTRIRIVLTEYCFKLYQKLYFYLFQNRAPPISQFNL